jgi:hypothetical protein
LQVKKHLTSCLLLAMALLLTSCSDAGSTKQIRATLFLLDASGSMIRSVSEREQQLKERLTGAFQNEEAIYFDFIRNDYTKQVILPLISMQSIISVNDIILEDAKNEKVRKETKAKISELWQQALSNSKETQDCIESVSTELLRDTVIEDQGARRISNYICVSANKAKEIFASIRTLGSGEKIEDGYIGSDVEGAFIRGLKRLESESGNLLNSLNESVKVRATIVVSSDMVQSRAGDEGIVSTIRNMSNDEIAEFVTKTRGEQEFRELRPIVKIDGWLSTSGKISERDRQALEIYWKKWFSTLDLDEPDFGFGVMDWSVD